MSRATDNKHHVAQKIISFWLPAELLTALDSLIADRCRGLVGVKPSRQAWLQDVVRRELAAMTQAGGS